MAFSISVLRLELTIKIDLPRKKCNQYHVEFANIYDPIGPTIAQVQINFTLGFLDDFQHDFYDNW